MKRSGRSGLIAKRSLIEVWISMLLVGYRRFWPLTAAGFKPTTILLRRECDDHFATAADCKIFSFLSVECSFSSWIISCSNFRCISVGTSVDGLAFWLGLILGNKIKKAWNYFTIPSSTSSSFRSRKNWFCWDQEIWKLNWTISFW